MQSQCNPAAGRCRLLGFVSAWGIGSRPRGMVSVGLRRGFGLRGPGLGAGCGELFYEGNKKLKMYSFNFYNSSFENFQFADLGAAPFPQIPNVQEVSLQYYRWGRKVFDPLLQSDSCLPRRLA